MSWKILLFPPPLHPVYTRKAQPLEIFSNETGRGASTAVTTGGEEKSSDEAQRGFFWGFLFSVVLVVCVLLVNNYCVDWIGLDWIVGGRDRFGGEGGKE